MASAKNQRQKALCTKAKKLPAFLEAGSFYILKTNLIKNISAVFRNKTEIKNGTSRIQSHFIKMTQPCFTTELKPNFLNYEKNYIVL
ncbi:MAG TPA: hypothetical protein DD619_01030 [Alphaproteobacteria bacterium]|nr:hypothetical protein [Alphaproteobacteria bacterium]